MRHYEVMIILDPSLDERTVAPSLENYLNVIRTSGGSVEKVDVWGKRRLAYEIDKHSEGIYAVVNLTATSATTQELNRQLGLSEAVLRTKVLRADELMGPIGKPNDNAGEPRPERSERPDRGSRGPRTPRPATR
jgi:small subunit ribosomal protein S6